MGAGRAVTGLSTSLRFSHHAESPAATQQAPDLEVFLFQLERALVCQLLTDSQGHLPRAGSQLGTIICHINTASQVHQAHYFIRQNLLSFGSCNIPRRKGSGTNRERYMVGSRQHVCAGVRNPGENRLQPAEFSAFSTHCAYKAVMG